jgi:hypothetical protein
MDKRENEFVAGLLPLEARVSARAHSCEQQMIDFFNFCYPGERRFRKSHRRTTEYHAALIAFSIGSRKSSDRILSKQLKLSLADLVNCEGATAKIEARATNAWHEKVEDRVLFENFTAPISRAKEELRLAREFLEDVSGLIVVDGRPKNLNLTFLIQALALFFIYELSQETRATGSRPPDLLPLYDNYDASLKNLSKITDYVIKLISNCLQAIGGEFGNVPGTTIRNVIRECSWKTVAGKQLGEHLKALKS